MKETNSIKFFNGLEMPTVGLGTYSATEAQELETALEEALKAGYRHIDTAFVYQNESLIGNVLKSWLDEGKVKREELFIVTKLPGVGMHPSKVGNFLQKSLTNLQLDYIDLYLIHTPCGVKYVQDGANDGEVELDMETDLEAIWKAMEEQVDRGFAKSIGVSNFNCEQIERIMRIARIQPANNQIEVNIYCQRKDVRRTCENYRITVCAYAPLGRPGKKLTDTMLEDPTIVKLAEKYDKTPAQIALRFLVQQSLAIIPKSVTPSRIQQNIQVFDFELSESDLKELVELDRGIQARVCLNAKTRGFDKHPEWPFPKD